jgi:hypothetical protein
VPVLRTHNMLKTRVTTHNKLVFRKSFLAQDFSEEVTLSVCLYINFCKKSNLVFMLDFSEGCEKPM